MACTNHSPNTKCVTELKNIYLAIKDNIILNNVSLELTCNSITALIGSNGAGKSSLIRSLIGEIKVGGQIFFNGEKRKPRIGYVPQNLSFTDNNPCTVNDLFYLYYRKTPIWLPFKKKLDVEKYLSKVGSESLVNRPLYALSGGELRKVFLALALAEEPQILVLDEPNTGLDKNGEELFYKLLSDLKEQYDLAILLVSHNFSLINKYADKIYFLDKGTIIEKGIPADIFKKDSFLKIFGKFND